MRLRDEHPRLEEMSEEVKEAPETKKKKGKLPVILALLLVLGGGGFFVMKGKGGPPKVVVKAGTAEQIKDEFLINLAGGPGIYLRAEVALQLRDGVKKEGLEEHMPAIRDAINQILRSKTLQQVGASQTEKLRKELATAINEILIGHMTPEEKKAQTEFEKATSEEPAHEKDKKNKKEEEKEEEWACPAGPVLTVFFTSFTTQ
jgi:flagellar protein FliL